MKEIQTPDSAKIGAEYISNNDFVGLQFPESRKAALIRVPGGQFCGMSLDKFSCRVSTTANTKAEYLKAFLQQKAVKAFKFDTSEELVGWLIKK